MDLTLETDRKNETFYLSLSRRAFRKGAVARTVRVDDDIALDFDASGALLGLDVMNARERLGRNWHDVRLDALVGVKEAAALLGVQPPNLLRDHVTRREFPKPLAELASGRVWLRSQVEAYAQLRAAERRAS